MSSTGKIDANIYNRRSRSIAQGVAPASGNKVTEPKVGNKKSSDNQIVIHNNDGGSKARYGSKWTGTVTRDDNEEEFNLADLTIGEDGKLKGHGSDESGDFKFEGIHGRGEVNATQTYTNKKVIYYTGKITE